MMQFQCKAFEQLTLKELYAIMRLRQEVFVVEQDCPYLDCDDKDIVGHQVFWIDNGICLATIRLLPAGTSYPDFVSLGRVATHESIRGTGVGKAILDFSIDVLRKLYPNQKIKISAQQYLENFYAARGFKKVGDAYLEDNIPHIAMILAD